MNLTVFLYEDCKDLQTRIKDSLDSTYKDFLKHDWLEEGLNFTLMKYYTNLSWEKMVNVPMERKKIPMESIDDILKVPGAGEKCIKILVEGQFWIYEHFKNMYI